MYARIVKSRKSTCFQIGYKRQGRFVLVKHVGCASTLVEIEALKIKSQGELIKAKKQLPLFVDETPTKAKQISWKVTGYHQFFGKVYDSLKFPDNLLRDLVVARIVFPHSKLATVRFLDRVCNIKLSKDKIYRFLKKIDKDELTEIAYSHIVLKNKTLSLVFYDVTTLHFEMEREDDLRRKGFAKNHRNDLPQILVGLFVDSDGFPFDFDFFSGNTFEGDTFSICVEKLITKYQLKTLTVVADAGMLSSKNLDFLESHHLNYIVGARLKSLNNKLKTKILGHNFTIQKTKQLEIINKRLIVNFSEARRKKDESNREKVINKLQLKIDKRQTLISKNKYLLLESESKIIGINQAKINEDKKYDGLKGYLTNLNKHNLNSLQVIDQYRNLWKVEKAFRMSKSDLRERPIYHHGIEKIRSHLVLCFVSLLVMKVAEKILAKKTISLNHAIELLSKVGQGQTKVGNIILETESEVNKEIKTILNLN